MKLGIAGALTVFISLFLFSCQNENEIEFKRYYSSGKLVYQDRCQNCHGANGEGLAALNPPINDSVYFKKNKPAIPCLIKFGLKGTVIVNHKFYEGQMPPSDLSPVEIAEVLTYIQNSFGNKMGVTTTAQVDSDLKNCK